MYWPTLGCTVWSIFLVRFHSVTTYILYVLGTAQWMDSLRSKFMLFIADIVLACRLTALVCLDRNCSCNCFFTICILPLTQCCDEDGMIIQITLFELCYAKRRAYRTCAIIYIDSIVNIASVVVLYQQCIFTNCINLLQHN